jgi:hypothetical protein
MKVGAGPVMRTTFCAIVLLATYLNRLLNNVNMRGTNAEFLGTLEPIYRYSFVVMCFYDYAFSRFTLSSLHWMIVVTDDVKEQCPYRHKIFDITPIRYLHTNNLLLLSQKREEFQHMALSERDTPILASIPRSA